MSDIYRNAGRTLAWIGEAPPQLAQETFELIEELAFVTQRLGLGEFSISERIQPPETLEIRSNYYLENLLEDDIWLSLADVLASRDYFYRVWTLQEIALSSVEKTTVNCGVYSISWRTFRDAAFFINHSGILVQDLESQRSLTGLFNVTAQADVQDVVQENAATVIDCLRATYTRGATELRDRIFGLTGMLDTSSRSELQELNYSTSLGRIFQKTTEMAIREDSSLNYLLFRTFVTDSLEEIDVPSWVMWMDNDPLREVPAHTDFEIDWTEGITISSSTMQTSGFVLDLVIDTTDNLSTEHLGRHVLRCYDDCIKSSATSEDRAVSLEVLWQIIMLLDRAPTGDELSNFVAWCVGLKIQNEDYATGEVNAMAKVGGNAKHRFSDSEIADLVEPDSTNHDGLFETYCEGILYDSRKCQGRNLFSTRRGYCGVGPAGVNRPGNNSPAVQAGDLITVLSTAPAPIILRKIDEQYYKLVGLAHIPHITEDLDFKKGMLGNFQRFLIR
ncbi:hypothetical protein N431DRAFT_554023 [Stipitochalara longipes BDJ]|nr:hypothetical protein N431DRAFT_554023 [Stipitochalara longipes BDJ]